MSKKNKAPETPVEAEAPVERASSLPWAVGIGTVVVVLGGFAAAVAVIQGGSREPIHCYANLGCEDRARTTIDV